MNKGGMKKSTALLLLTCNTHANYVLRFSCLLRVFAGVGREILYLYLFGVKILPSTA